MKFEIEQRRDTGMIDAEICAQLKPNTNTVEIYVCDHWVCHSIDLTKNNVSDLIDALVKMKEVMHD